MNINIKGDMKSAGRFLDKLQRRQIPFGTSLALNASAVKIQKLEKRMIQNDLDNPTPQVVKSIRVARSSKRNLEASVFIIAPIARFLQWQIEGGTRPARGRSEAVPVGTRLNKYGNIIGRRQGKIAKLLARPDTFSGTIRGVAGVWQRGKGRSRSIKLLVAYYPRVQYRARFPFYRYASKALNRIWVREFRRGLARAMRG